MCVRATRLRDKVYSTVSRDTIIPFLPETAVVLVSAITLFVYGRGNAFIYRLPVTVHRLGIFL